MSASVFRWDAIRKSSSFGRFCRAIYFSCERIRGRLVNMAGIMMITVIVREGKDRVST